VSLQSFDDIPQLALDVGATRQMIQQFKDTANAIKTDDELEAQMPKLLKLNAAMINQFPDHDQGTKNGHP
jgi:hypothetical protein